jgi:hypothetical protein
MTLMNATISEQQLKEPLAHLLIHSTHIRFIHIADDIDLNDVILKKVGYLKVNVLHKLLYIHGYSANNLKKQHSFIKNISVIGTNLATKKFRPKIIINFTLVREVEILHIIEEG